MTLTLVTYNIQYGFGRDGRYDLARAIDAVKSADVIALQEVERNWSRTGMRDQPQEIAALLPEHFWVYGAPFDVDAGGRDAAGRAVTRRRQFGLMVLSRWPIQSTRLHPLPKQDTGEVFNMATGMAETVIAAPGQALRVCNIHLGHLNTRERLDQIARLRAVVQAAAREGGVWNGREPGAPHWHSEGPPPARPEATILLGDFNAMPGTAEYSALLAPADPGSNGQKGAGLLVDAWAAAGNPEAGGITFRADPRQGVFVDMRIDYCFLDPSLAPRIRRCWTDGEAIGSDHQPVWLEIET
jgi:endonuclease/exonuclease/phosphatase family metal-dependent hydrolase